MHSVLYAPGHVCSNCDCILAGDLNWFNPDTGETVVYNLGDIAWIISATALVWIMIPGVGYFYSGLLRRKNALSMIFLGVAVLAVVSFQVRELFLLLSFLKSDKLNSIYTVVLLGIFSRFLRDRLCLYRRFEVFRPQGCS